jgi:MYXO-CTERM domain-containing protein
MLGGAPAVKSLPGGAPPILAPPARNGQAPHGPTLHAAIIQAVQAGADSRYAAVAVSPDTVRVVSPEQQMSTTLGPGGTRVEVPAKQGGQTHSITFRLGSLGCASNTPSAAPNNGEDAQPAGPPANSLGTRVELSRQGLVEWYQNGSLGLEQGFDLNAPPSCRQNDPQEYDPVVLALDMEHELQAQLMENQGAQRLELRDTQGQTVLYYSDLYAEDATGQALPTRLALSGNRLTLRIDDRGARYPLRVDPLIWTQTGGAYKDANPVGGALLGTAIAISGDYAAVGAPFDSTGGKAAGAGFIFQLNAQGVWTEQLKILGATANAQLGAAVDITDAGSGNKRAVFGAPGDTSGGKGMLGSASFYLGSGSSFTAEAAFSGTGNFGSAVAISGTFIVVGSPTDNSSDGTVEIFAPTGMSPFWAIQTTLSGTAGSAEGFGTAVDIDGNVAVVGSPTDSSVLMNAGSAAVYTYNVNTGTWPAPVSLTASDAAAGDGFGQSVAISGETVIIGAPNKGSKMGGAYAYSNSLGMWAGEQRLHMLSGIVLAAGDGFGGSVDLAGNLAAIGASGTVVSGLSQAGAVYVLTSASSVWSLYNMATEATPTAAELFGSAVSVDVSGSHILIGAPGNDGGGGASSGAFYDLIQLKSNGDACAASTECASNFCVDGVCCNNACGGGVDTDCQACAVAKGAATDGTCGTTQAAAKFVCHPSAGVCDVAEVCDGVNPTCPTDTFQPSTTVCRAAVPGGCDNAGMCTGSSAACPADVVVPANTVCRPSAGPCDVAEVCNGISNTCPGDARAPAGLVCRSATGPCDLAASCDGTNVTCPANGFVSSSTVCRPSVSICDVAEFCTGNAAACPPDGFAPSTTVCHAPVGTCDTTTLCTGASNACPPDVVLAANTVCRASAGPCDVAELCDGVSGACPADARVPAGVICRLAADVCDIAASCDGTNVACPPNGFLPITTVCRPSVGICDVAENCTGSSAACPPDSFAPSTTVCRPSDGACDLTEMCTGTANTCPLDMVLPSGTVCRASTGVCDASELCDGLSGACPGDLKIPAGVVCRPAGNDCALPAACDGSTDSCPVNGTEPDGTICSLGTCQMASCRSEADLAVAAAASPPYTGGQAPLGFTIGVGNIGRSPTTGVVLSIQVPAGTELVSGGGDSWTCQLNSPTEIDCDRGSLDVGENSLVVLALTPPSQAASFTLTATVSSAVFDPDTLNNSSSVNESLLSAQYAGGGVGCNVAPGSAPASSSLWLLGLVGILAFRRRRWS